jgi:hypothetical protein
METQDNEKQEFNITVYTENQIGLLTVLLLYSPAGKSILIA